MNINRFYRGIRKLFWALSGVLFVSAAIAQTQPGARTPEPTPGIQQPGGVSQAPNSLNSSQPLYDRDFVKQALEGAMAEVELGKIAAQKGSSEDVKSFAQKMIDDHTKMEQDMLQVARQVGVKPPTGLSKKDKGLVAKLQGLSGSQFDVAYIKAMVKDHKNDLDNFKTEAQNAQIPAVKDAAAQGEPIIANHLQIIQKIAQAHKSEGA